MASALTSSACLKAAIRAMITPLDHIVVGEAATKTLVANVRARSSSPGPKGETPCKFFGTPEGCRKGDNCDFKHPQ